MALSFLDYKKDRQRVDEIFDFLKKTVDQGKQAAGYQDEKGQTSVDKVAGIKGAEAAKDTAGGVGGAVSAGAGLAANVATGNFVGAAFSVWDLIKQVASVGSGIKSMSQAGSMVSQCLKHKAGLQQHLLEQKLQPNMVKQAVDAVFEIDGESAFMIPNPLWGQITTDFGKRLATGYHDIESKVFSVIAAEHMMAWYKEHFGDKADQSAGKLRAALQHLQQESQQAQAILSKPEIKQKVEEFTPDAEGHHQAQEAPKAEPEKTKEKKSDPQYGPITIDRWERIPDVFFEKGGDTKIKDDMVDEFWRWATTHGQHRGFGKPKLSSEKLVVGKPIYVHYPHGWNAYRVKGILLGIERAEGSGYFDAKVKVSYSDSHQWKPGEVANIHLSDIMSASNVGGIDEDEQREHEQNEKYKRYGISSSGSRVVPR